MILFACGILAGLCIGASAAVGLGAYCMVKLADCKEPERLIQPSEAEIQRSWDLAIADYFEEGER